MRLVGYIDLPTHDGPGGFDHAAVHLSRSLLYVAHTANSAIDVIDIRTDRYVESITGLGGVAGALVDEATDLVFTSNRGEDTVGIFSPERPRDLVKVAVGSRPNGLAFDSGRKLLLAAGVGEPYSFTLVDVARSKLVGTIDSPGRTRWTVYDTASDAFYVNVGDPAVILVVDGAEPTRIARQIPIPAKGPHGLDIDGAGGYLFCACDEGKIFKLRARSGDIVAEASLSGVPDVLWFNASLQRIYVAVGDPGVIDVFDAGDLTRVATVSTEKGAHTTGFDSQRNVLYAFLPETHRAAVFIDA